MALGNRFGYLLRRDSGGWSHELGAGTTQHTSMAVREQVAILQGFGEKWPLMDPYLRSQESQRHVVRQWYACIHTENWNRGMASEDACQYSLKSRGPSINRLTQVGSAGRWRFALTIEELFIASKKVRSVIPPHELSKKGEETDGPFFC